MNAKAVLERAAASVADETLPYQHMTWRHCATGHLYRAIHGGFPPPWTNDWLMDDALRVVITAGLGNGVRDWQMAGAAMALSTAVFDAALAPSNTAVSLASVTLSLTDEARDLVYRNVARTVLLAAAERAGAIGESDL